MSRIKSMTEDRPAGLILSFALPLMVGNVFQQLYTVVDTMVVGKALGVGALAALGACDWLNWMMLGIIQGLTQGFGILMAQDFGAGKWEELRKAVGGSVVLAIGGAVFLTAAGQAAARPVLELLKTPPEILGDALLYLRIMFFGVPVVMAYNLLACVLRSLGDGKTPLHAMVVAALVNIGLDLLFVLAFGWGIAGAAAATLIAQFVSSLFCLWHIRRIDFLRLTRTHLRPAPPLAAKLLSLGSPMAFQNGIIAVGGMIVQSVVNGFGVIFIAGFTATNKLYGVLEIAATSYGYSMVTYVGQNLGAGKPGRIRMGVRQASGIALATSLVIMGAMFLFGRLILGCFISGTPQEVEETMRVAWFYLAVMSLFLPVLYILHVVRSAIQGMGNTVLPMVSGIAEFVMRTGTAVLLPLWIGERGIFYAEILAWMGADVILIASYFATIKRVERTQGRGGRPF